MPVRRSPGEPLCVGHVGHGCSPDRGPSPSSSSIAPLASPPPPPSSLQSVCPLSDIAHDAALFAVILHRQSPSRPSRCRQQRSVRVKDNPPLSPSARHLTSHVELVVRQTTTTTKQTQITPSDIGNQRKKERKKNTPRYVTHEHRNVITLRTNQQQQRSRASERKKRAFLSRIISSRQQ